MRKLYLQPIVRTLGFHLEGVICLSGGTAGNPGDPGAQFNDDDIFDGGNL